MKRVLVCIGLIAALAAFLGVASIDNGLGFVVMLAGVAVALVVTIAWIIAGEIVGPE